MVLEDTDTDFIRHKAMADVENARPMRVTGIHEHVAQDDDVNWEVDVVSLDEQVSHGGIEMLGASSNKIEIPRVGDKVLVIYTHGNRKEPVALPNQIFTNTDRPTLGKAGMSRKKVPSGSSPLGPGSIYVTEYTSYDKDPALKDKGNLTAQESWVQIAKHKDDKSGTATGGTAGAKIELYDSPNNDAAHVTIKLTKKNGSNSSANWGLKFDAKTGEMKLLDPAGYGIVSDGSGNFDWYEKSVNFVDDGTTDSL